MSTHTHKPPNMIQKLKFIPVAATVAALTWLPAKVQAQDIVFTSGVADVTFFYDSVADSFDVVFRSKGVNTSATNLTSPYGTPPGGVGGSADDYNFSTLTAVLSAAPTVNVGGTNFYVSPASGTGYATVDQPDVGIRTRFRENPGPVDQFATFRLTLDLGNSVLPSGAEVAIFRTDGDLSVTATQLNTATATLQSDWGVYGHEHWHWGFSELGDYNLVFNIQGLGGTEGPTAVGTFELGFQVIPEPSSAAVALGAVAAAAVYLRRRQRSSPALG